MRVEQLYTIPPRAHIATRIKALNKFVVGEVVTVAEYQRLIKAHLRAVSNWHERQHLENLALLPVEWRNG